MTGRLVALGLGVALIVVAALGLYLANHGVIGHAQPETAVPKMTRSGTGSGAVLMPVGLQSVPADGPLSIVILGTSLTYYGDWPQRVGESLSACRGAAVSVTTIAKPGASSAWGDPAWRAWLDDQNEAVPDILITEFAVNDASLFRGLTLSRSRHHHARILEAAQARGILPILATMNPAFGRNSWERPGLQAYMDLYRILAREEGLILIDTVPVWEALPVAERAALMPDGLHPTRDGKAKVTVPAFLSVLAPIICPGRTDP